MKDEARRAAIEQLRLEAGAVPQAMLQEHPIEAYIAHYGYTTGLGAYARVPAACAASCSAIAAVWGEEGLGQYHRLVLLTMLANLNRHASNKYPASILACRERYLGGLLAQLQRQPASFYQHSNDRFAKDLAVCRHKLVPCGAQFVDVHAGVPRSLLARQKPSTALGMLAYMLGSLGGFKVLYELHMDPRLVLEFNPKGWELCYARIADLLAFYPHVRGVFGTSWWFDPALATISPRLDFLRDIPLAGGARLFPSGHSQASMGNAIANSRERKVAVEDGSYRPADWCMVWSRAPLMDWANGRPR